MELEVGHGETEGRPIAFDLTPGEAADCKSYDTLIDLPERTPDALVADKAYDSDAIRSDLKQRGIRAVIPPKSNRTKTICYNKRLYRQRNTAGLPSKQTLPWRCRRRLDTRPELQRTSTAESTLHGVVFQKMRGAMSSALDLLEAQASWR